MAFWHITLGLVLQILLCIFFARKFAGREVGYTKEDRTLFQSDRGKVLITGTGRSGTTFLIQLFTFLDLDTTSGKIIPNISMAFLDRAWSAPSALHINS